MQYDKFQSAVIDEVRDGSGNLAVSAVAGSGKSTTLVEAVRQLVAVRGSQVLLTAFNKDIQEELKRRAPDRVDVRTLHSIGQATVRQHWGNKVRIDGRKGWQMVWKVLRAQGRAKTRDSYTTDLGKYAPAVHRLVSLVKGALCSSKSEVEALARRHRLVDKHVNESYLADLAIQVLQAGSADRSSIDFDDMIYLPVKYNMLPAPYDVVVTDEVQDINAAQHALVKMLVRPGGRMIAFGDPRQGIYHFRGADGAIFKTMAKEGFKSMPLSVTYRCSQSVVDFVKPLVPQIQARPGADPGIVRHVSMDYVAGPWGPKIGDYVLARDNAAVAKIAKTFLRQHIPCVIAGKEVGRELADIIEESKANTVLELELWMSLQVEEAKEQIAEEEDPTVRQELVDSLNETLDRYEAIRAIADDETSVVAVLTTLNEMFANSDLDESALEKMLVVATVHQVKGRERERVWLLMDSFKHDKNPTDEERNIFYVACTRAQDALFLCYRTVPDGAVDLP